MTEVCWLERWPEVEATFLAEVARGAFELVHLTPTDLARMGELVLRYADFPLGVDPGSHPRPAVLQRHQAHPRLRAGTIAVARPVSHAILAVRVRLAVYAVEPIGQSGRRR
jgi:hypothetical protein